MTTSFRNRNMLATVHGKQVAYIDEGSSDPIIFLLGNPMSSYLWRDIVPYLAGRGRTWTAFRKKPWGVRGIAVGSRRPNGAEKNMFVEAILPALILRDLSAEELDEYRSPIKIAGEDHRPTLIGGLLM